MEPSGRAGNRPCRAALRFVAAFLLFCSCMPEVIREMITVPPLDDESARACAQKWEKYGAYYEKHITTFTASYAQYECSTRMETDLALRILTNSGARYATIPMPKHRAAMVVLFEPRLYDPSGTEVAVNRKAMKETYRETGKVVFPRVTAGSKLTLKIAVSLPYYYTAFWHEFATPIPSCITSFAHIHSQSAMYDYKTSGTRFPFDTDSTRSNWVQKARSWTIRGYEPRNSLEYMEHGSIAEPLVAFRLREVRCWAKKYNSPKEIYRDSRFHFGLVVSDMAADTLLKGALKACLTGGEDHVTRAEKILDWVQRYITVFPYLTRGNRSVLSKKSGSFIQAACLCKVMMKKAGINAEIVYAYDNRTLLMDTSFVFFNEYFATPLLLIHFKTITQVAYPYDAGWELGEYPSRFNGVLCIRPKEKTIEPLPPPRWGSRWIRDRMTIDLRSSPPVCCLSREYRRHSAAVMRDAYYGLSRERLRGRFERLVKAFSSSNRLDTFSLHGFHEKPAGPFSVEIRFTSGQTPLRSGDRNIFVLKDFLPEYFKDIFPGRTEDVVVHEDAVYIDEVEILKIPGRTASCDFRTRLFSNALFYTGFSSGETDSSYLFERTVNLKAGRIPAAELGALHRECTALNDFRNSSVTY